MGKYKNDMIMVIESMLDEAEAMESCKEMLKNVACPELRKIFTEILTEEDKHARALLRWINLKVS